MKKEFPPLPVKRKYKIFAPEEGRVIARKYMHGAGERSKKIVYNILNLSENEAHNMFEDIMAEFSVRHRHFIEKLESSYKEVAKYVPEGVNISKERELLIGAYFTHEYSVEAAALFNPSIVLHPDQSGLAPLEVRFIMSFRATGEGHISSIEFRSGILDKRSNIFLDPVSPYVETPELHPNSLYNRLLFRMKLNEIGAASEVTEYVMNKLKDEFTLEELNNAIRLLDIEVCFIKNIRQEAVNMMLWLARSNYEVSFNPKHHISERVIFPVSQNESRGIEDARFVRFVDDDGSIMYYATYTAYNGMTILPQLIETKDFVTFKIITLNGKAVQNKGMALFPRKINGKFVMLSRQDGVNNYIMYSDNLHFWHEYTLLQSPRFAWEFVQIGNCGTPLETEHGWLSFIHGVGPMRKYSIGIQLLDLNDPSKIIARLEEPVLTPNEHEREGYVPNVVYSCGSMIHNNNLIIPYAMSDSRCSIATISLTDLFERLK